MSSDFSALVSNYEEFKKLFSEKNPPLDKCQVLMDKIKVAMARFAYPGFENVSVEEEKKRILLCREMLENGILLSIDLRDIDSFTRYFAQIKTFYYDYSKKYSLPSSSRQYMMVSLNLLRLLAQQNLAQFHTELELIPLDQHHSNVFIKHAVYLEQCMMEGSYNKVIKHRAEVPSERHAYFMEMLMDTVRNEIAECTIKALHSLSVQDAQKLLGFTNEEELKKYAATKNWQIYDVNGTKSFVFKKDDSNREVLPAEEIIKRTLHYAKELERIV